jgi:DNA mismatch repair protein MutS2
LKVADAFVAEMIEKYTALYQKLEASRKEILDTARGEARRIIAGSNKLIEKTVKELREADASKEAIKEVRATFVAQAEQIAREESAPLEVQGRSEALVLLRKKEEAARNIELKKLKEPLKDLKTGDWVSMKGHPSPGEVITVSGKKVEVAFGDVRMKVDMSKLERTRKPDKSRTAKGSVISYSHDLQTKSALFRPELDVRGQRAEAALSNVRSFIDDAVLLNVHELKLLHGKGDGILRQVLRDFLSSVPEVKRCTDAHPEHGGHGVTLISMR